jgi:hypothetical protein
MCRRALFQEIRVIQANLNDTTLPTKMFSLNTSENPTKTQTFMAVPIKESERENSHTSLLSSKKNF